MRARISVLALFLVFVMACGSKRPTPTPAASDTRSLYERLGGLPAIEAVVKDFVATTGADPRIAQFFTNADIPRLEKLMVEQICAATGGPCTYSGKSMKESHTGMKVKEEHFTAFIDDLTKVLAKFEVGPRETEEVLAAFNAMKPDVVEP